MRRQDRYRFPGLEDRYRLRLPLGTADHARCFGKEAADVEGRGARAAHQLHQGSLLQGHQGLQQGTLETLEAGPNVVRIIYLLFSQFQIATVTAEGVMIEGPLELETNWTSATMVQGYE